MGEGVREIPLTKGLVALVDAADFDWLSSEKWHAAIGSRATSKPYAATKRTSACVRILMHRLILGAQEGQIVDHINGDSLDNRRANLRFATAAQNSRNVGPFRNNAAGLKGVRLCKGRWMARIQSDGKPIYLGSFDTAEAAAKAYDRAACSLHGEFAGLNFPEAN